MHTFVLDAGVNHLSDPHWPSLLECSVTVASREHPKKAIETKKEEDEDIASESDHS